MEQKVHFKNLDALRFLAFMSVFVSHVTISLGFTYPGADSFNHTWLTHGDLGVSFFFVLSGFLITYLLITEKSTGTISLFRFYLRRMLRIWPVYFLVFGLGFFVIPHFALHPFPFPVINNGTSPLWFVFFLANIKLALSYGPPAILVVLWSISVEEQFYVIWPIIIKRFLRTDLIIILIGVIISSCIYRFTTSDSYNAVHYFTLSVFSDIAIGALTALVVFSKNNFIALIEKIPRGVIIAMYLVMFALIPLRTLYPHLGSHFVIALLTAIEPIVFSCFFAFILLEQTYAHHSFFKFGTSKLLTALGKISYGLYAYHMIAFFLVITLLHNLFGIATLSPNILFFIIKIIGSFTVTIILAKLSYRLIELPFLNLKNKFGYGKK